MPKCWIHGQTAQEKPAKPLKTHPGFPEDSIKQGLAICLAPEVKDNQISELQAKVQELDQFAAEKIVLEGEIQQLQINYQHLQQVKDKEIAELKNKLNQLIERVMNLPQK